MKGQLILPGVDLNYRGWSPPVKLRPLVKWAGGKRWAVPIFAPNAWLHLANTGGRYVEPFCGGGAVAFWLGWPRTVLGDACRPLMEMYAAVQARADDVVKSLQSYIDQGIDEKAYYEIRSKRPTSRIAFSGWMLYLSKTAFNGLWRENRSGGFNVPYGRYAKPAFVTEDHLVNASTMMRTWEIRCTDFTDTLSDVGENDLVYCDPPYLGTKGGFTGYVHASWTQANQVRLAEVLREVIGRGAVVVCSDAGTGENKAVYAALGLTVMPVVKYHSIGARGDRRGRRPELIATNCPRILSSEGVR